MTPLLDRRISRFYRRWHDLESQLGHHKGLVIDFDMAPRDGDAPQRPFGSRSEAIAECQSLVDAVAQWLPSGPLHGDPHGPRNPAYTHAKLAGSLAYLWALTGERLPFADYLEATMGIQPRRVSDEDLRRLSAKVAQRCADRGIAWAPSGRLAFRDALGRDNLDGFEAELRSAARDQIARLDVLLPGLPTPEYAIEVVCLDAYWCNWIDGTVEDGVTLKVNTHARNDYQRASHIDLAAHEIAGHAAHVAALRRSHENGCLDGSTLNLTVHACDAFQMEGLAQVALHVLADIGPKAGPLHPDLQLTEALRGLSGARMGNAQIDVEAGVPMVEVWNALQQDMPLSGSLSTRASLRDRSRSPLHRAYIHVYAPARRMFMRLLEVPADERAPIVQALYEEMWTPGQIELLIRGESRADVRQQQPPAPAP